MRPMGKRPWILATLASIAFLSSAVGARASSITIKWSDDDTAPQTTTLSSTNGTYSFLGGLADTTDFTNIVGRVTTNDNNFTPNSIQIRLSFSGDRKPGAGNKTLKIIAIDSNFSVFSRPYTGSDTISGSANPGDLVKNTSDFNPTPPPPSLLTLVISETAAANGNLAAMTTSGPFTGTGSGFTLQDTLEVTEASGETGNGFAQGTTQASVVTPEPISVVSALSGLAVLGAGAWMRRKKAVVV
jgi:hypothetical protein